MVTKNETDPVPELPIGEIYRYGMEHTIVRFVAEWSTRQFGVICDLDLNAYCYDDRARFIEKLDVSCKRTADGALSLMSDIDGQTSQSSNTFFELIKLDFRLVDPATTAILLVLDGGNKYFQLVSNMWLHCSPLSTGKAMNMPGQKAALDLFTFTEKAKKEYQAVGLGVIFRDGWMEEDTARTQWCLRALMEPIYAVNSKAKDEKCLNIVVRQVPALEKFKPRLFGNVKDLCSALSSIALPKLKKKFISTPGGLDINTFTEVIFRQIHETHPLIVEPSECAYTVAMIQEMFQQIDYNGDGGADWDEFTTFCIQTASSQDNAASTASMDEYVIEYTEDISLRERRNTAFRPAAAMKYFPEIKRFVVIPDEQDRINIQDLRFRTRSVLKADNMIVKSKTGAKEAMKANEEASSKVLIYDVVYLSGREMYAFSSSDHGISICKEQGSAGSKKVNILLYTKLYHSQLHLKLCWSKANKLLCSVGADRTIFGWDIDKPQPLFQLSRHTDIITDFIAVDNLDCFITCSMDKRIVMWSAHTRRVKGIMVGHQRGVRSLSHYDTLLLSAGYELDARTWNLNSKENLAILRGHRQPIVAAKLMCQLATNERDYRAVTVDESGELRLWNVYVGERMSDPVSVPTLQIFTMLNPEHPMKYIKFLAIPNISSLSTSYYSDLVACGTRMLHFVPEKSAKEFIPPSAAVFNEASAEFVVVVGRKLLKYDVCTGVYVGAFEPCAADISALALELPRGRRLFAGSSNGDIMIINYDSGLILDAVNAHMKEVAVCIIHNGDRNQVFSGSIDGRLVSTEETDGSLHIHNTIDRAFGDASNGLPVGIANIKISPSVGVAVVQSAGASWGLWDMKTFKRRFIFTERSAVMAFEILGASGDAQELAANDGRRSAGGIDRIYHLTVAIALQGGINVYTVDIAESRGVCAHRLTFDRPTYITSMCLLSPPDGDSVNYAAAKVGTSRLKLALVCASDEGRVIVWEVQSVREMSDKRLRQKFGASHKNAISSNGPPADSRPTSRLDAGFAFHDNGNAPADGGAGTNDRVQTASTGSRPATADAIEEGLDGGSQISLTSSMLNSLSIDAELFFGPPAGKAGIESIASHGSWTTHLDSICVTVPMHEHGCLVTGSHDGFLRVWNMDADIMGELQLPNLTNKMKHPSKPIFPHHPLWKFILEKIPITEAHRALAAYLVDVIRTAEPNRSHHIDAAHFNIDGLVDDGDDESEHLDLDEQTRLRMHMLRAMVAAVKVPDDAPPVTIPSRAERKLEAIAAALEEHAQQTHSHSSQQKRDTSDQHGDTGAFMLTELSLEESTVEVSTGNLEPILLQANDTAKRKEPATPVSKSPNLKPIQTGTSPVRRQKPLYYAAGDGIRDKSFIAPPAFSDQSIMRGQQEKTLDEESMVLLRKFSATASEKIEQYEASGSTILLRNPSLSTTIMLPELATMRRAEIKFGVQKDLYKNAEKELNAASNLKADKMRDAITRGRIEHNAKKLNSMMMTVITPASHDDISIPNQQEAWKEMQEKDIKEHFRMKVRLMQSASLVSLEAKDKFGTRSLDRVQLKKLTERVLSASLSEAELKHDLKYQKKPRGKVRLLIEPTAKEYLFKKFKNAIRDEYIHRNKAELAALGISTAAMDEFFAAASDSPMTSPGPVPAPALLKVQTHEGLGHNSVSTPTGGAKRASTAFSADVKGGAGSSGPARPPTTPVHGSSQPDSPGTPGLKGNEVDFQPSEYSGDGIAIEQHVVNRAHGIKVVPGTPKTPGSAHVTIAGKSRSAATPNTAPIPSTPNTANSAAARKRGGTASTQTGASQPGTPATGRTGTLTTRMLLPYYKMDDVQAFLEIFARVDENFSGDLNMDEWTNLFKSISNNIPAQEARSIFMKFKNEDGFLSMKELVPVVFSKASKEQIRQIISFCNGEIVRKHEGMIQLTFSELEQLFDIMDERHQGFVAVSAIREQVRSLSLQESMISSCLSNFKNVDDDEMVSHAEFIRFFKMYISRAELLAEKTADLKERFKVT